MSYILEAIKKSEQEREQGNVPHLYSVHSFNDANEEENNFPWPRFIIAVLFILLASAGLFAWFMVSHVHNEEKVASNQPVQVERQNTGTFRQMPSTKEINKLDTVKPVKLAEVSESVRLVPPELKSNTAVNNKVPVKISTVPVREDIKKVIGKEDTDGLDVAAVKGAMPEQLKQAKPGNKQTSIDNVREENILANKQGHKEMLVDKPAIGREKQKDTAKATIQTQALQPPATAKKINTVAVKTDKVDTKDARGAAVDKSVAKKPVAKKPIVKKLAAKKWVVKKEMAVPHLVDLPESVKRSIPNLKYSGHVYSSLPSHRKVIINGSDIREGDLIADNLLLDEITADGVILQYNEHRFRIDLLKDWSFN